MSERERQSAAAPPDRVQPPSAVRVIAAAKSPVAPATPTHATKPAADRASTVLRPAHLEQLTEAVDVLRSGRSVCLVLDGFADAADRHARWPSSTALRTRSAPTSPPTSTTT